MDRDWRGTGPLFSGYCLHSANCLSWNFFSSNPTGPEPVGQSSGEGVWFFDKFSKFLSVVLSEPLLAVRWPLPDFGKVRSWVSPAWPGGCSRWGPTNRLAALPGGGARGLGVEPRPGPGRVLSLPACRRYPACPARSPPEVNLASRVAGVSASCGLACPRLHRGAAEPDGRGLVGGRHGRGSGHVRRCRDGR